MKSIKNESGFTLVELMVVVAIIGILSAVAIPNFKKYQAKSKTSEAKLQLASIYSAETALQSDYDAFATCLEFAGYVGPAASNYYSVGFAASNATVNAIVDGNSSSTNCTVGGVQFGWPANKVVGGATSTVANLALITAPAFSNGQTAVGVDSAGAWFVAGAIGIISADSTTNTAATGSHFAIDENKELRQTQLGY